MHTVDLCRARNADISCTSQPRQWHKARGKKIYGQPVSSVVVAKAKVNRKRKPIMSSFIHNKYVFFSYSHILQQHCQSHCSECIPVHCVTSKTILTCECICYRKELGTGVYNLLREMSDAPISYITDASAPEVKVGGWKYAVGCGLSHQNISCWHLPPGLPVPRNHPFSGPDVVLWKTV
ncbi:hypothetical protein ATANTOWER_020917 [Ataeniobius toweri]|uniref:Uncharacterized protein n=1 Tax=Ataeniobius toweri TaxID=208326 RepID=A0ABU7C0M7_9TELE|nr:hypothetical protein [Ataeniobius toweri]